MNYIVLGIASCATLAGGIMSFFNAKKNKLHNMQLDKLDNTDIPCGSAFQHLKLSNSIGEKTK